MWLLLNCFFVMVCECSFVHLSKQFYNVLNDVSQMTHHSLCAASFSTTIDANNSCLIISLLTNSNIIGWKQEKRRVKNDNRNSVTGQLKWKSQSWWNWGGDW